jgi:hypothetical protein
VAAVKGGQVDALTTDSGLLKYFAQQNGPGLAVRGDRFSSEPYGLGWDCPTVPIGSYPQGVSPYGVHGISATSTKMRSPKTQQVPGSSKVIRGGAWNDGMQKLATSRRREFLPDDFEANLGFRCASSNRTSRLT